jgi:hypothetical protein
MGWCYDKKGEKKRAQMLEHQKAQPYDTFSLTQCIGTVNSFVHFNLPRASPQKKNKIALHPLRTTFVLPGQILMILN